MTNGFWCLTLGLLALAPSPLPAPAAGSGGYSIRVTQIETSSFPKVKVFVSVTDPSGHPISNDHKVQLSVLHDGREVASQRLSEGWKASAVLVIDRSGSMARKLAAARDSAKAFVARAQTAYDIAVLSFADVVAPVQDFSKDKALLASRIDGITAGGTTALQDALGTALDLLALRTGRKTVLLLTDGIENASRSYRGEGGLAALLERCRREEVTVSVIGLGRDVNETYLRRLAGEGGRYLFAPRADALQSAFLAESESLSSERVLEITSPSPQSDGLRRHLEVRLTVDDVPSAGRVDFVAPGVLPHVRGRHGPYAVALGGLLLLPGLVRTMRRLAGVARFRRRFLRRLRPGSAHLGATELNSGETLQAGDLVLLCPGSGTPHFPGSWRLNRCRCMRDPRCSGSLCYQQVLPGWLRRTLDRLSRHRKTERGSIWLCHCQGDADGY